MSTPEASSERDEKGRIYFSDPRYLGHEPVYQPGYAVYRLDPDGPVERIITDGGKTNGVLVSPSNYTTRTQSNLTDPTQVAAARNLLEDGLFKKGSPLRAA